jgi:hypothetical protein
MHMAHSTHVESGLVMSARLSYLLLNGGRNGCQHESASFMSVKFRPALLLPVGRDWT